MNKKIKYFIAISFIFFSIFLNAESIKKYDIDFKLLQSGELRVSENLLYDFGSQLRHGIYRDIPYTIKLNNFNRDIGLYDFEVYQDFQDANYIKEKVISNVSGKNTRIKIGDKNKKITSTHHYQIDYSVELGVLNRDEKYDVTSWNLIGNEWKYSIENIKAIIHLPESLSKSDTIINTFSGGFGSTTTHAKVKWLNQNSFEVSIAHLSARAGLTVDILYPVNSLEQSGISNQGKTLFEGFIGIWHWLAIFIIAMFNYKYFNRFASNKFARSVYPRYDSPKDLSILQSGLLYDKFANDKDFTPAIIELAQQGYLTISKTGQTTSVLKLEKDTKNLTDDMKYLLNNILFVYGTTSFEFKQKSNSEATALAQKFKNLNENLYEWSYNKNYMQTNPKKRRESFLGRIFLLSTPLMIISFFTSIMIVGEDTTIISLMNLVFITVSLVTWFSSNHIPSKIFAIIFAIFSQIIFLGFYTNLIFSDLLHTPLILGLVIAITTIYIYKNIGRYTRSGAMIKNHLDGLSEFISKVKEDEIKRRLKEDPLYLEKYLPYAILLGHTKHWISFYDSLKIDQPNWYYGDFNRISNISNDISRSFHAQAQPSSGSSYSSSGGGGFSGGGSGGGGGGSW